MATLSIQPNFVPANNQLFFKNKDLNSLQRAIYSDTFGFYQNLFNVFSYMQLTKLHRYKVHTPKAHPLVWQKWNSCATTSTGSLTMGVRELMPEPIYFKEKFCEDELLESAYDQLLDWSASGEMDMDEEGTRMFNLFIDELMANVAYGFRMTATSGGLYDTNTVPMSPDNTQNLSSLFKRTHGTFDGWIKLSQNMAQDGHGHMNLNLVDEGDFDEVDGFQGDIVDLLEGLKSNAKKPLKQLINRGGSISNGQFTFLPLAIMSDSFFQSVVRFMNDETEKQATNGLRITKRMFGPETSATPTRVFYLDDMVPIIPLEEINGFDQYINGQTHFCGIMASGVVQIGANFSRLPVNIEGNEVGMVIAKDVDPVSDTFGTYAVRSNALAKTAIADHNYFVGTSLFTEPDA